MYVLVLQLLRLLKPLAHYRNVASLNLFYSYYFGGCSSELAELVPRPHSCGSSTSHSKRLHDFSVTFPSKCYKDFYVNSFFPRTARLWNSLPAECFPLTYDINGFKSRANRHFFLWVLSIQFSSNVIKSETPPLVFSCGFLEIFQTAALLKTNIRCRHFSVNFEKHLSRPILQAI